VLIKTYILLPMSFKLTRSLTGTLRSPNYAVNHRE